MNGGTLRRIEDHPFFADWQGADLATLSKASEIRNYNDGDIVAEIGSSDFGCYFVLDGEVALWAPIEGHLSEIDRRAAGELFGEISLFTQEPFLARVVACGACTIAFVSQTAINEFFGRMPHSLSRLLRSLVKHIGHAGVGLAEKSHQHEKMAVVGSVVHDVVNDFQGSAQMINLGTEAINRLSRDRQVRLICSSITEQVRKIMDLAAELSVFAHNESEIRYVLVNLREFMDAFREENGDIFKNRDLSIHMDIADVSLEVEPVGMKKALRNLLRNCAFSLEREGGKVEISASRVENDRVKIVFRDNGKGVPEAVQKNYWEPFVNQETGIYMSVVKGVVENHGGVISLESKEGAGETFVMILPRFHVTVS